MTLQMDHSHKQYSQQCHRQFNLIHIFLNSHKWHITVECLLPGIHPTIQLTSALICMVLQRAQRYSLDE